MAAPTSSRRGERSPFGLTAIALVAALFAATGLWSLIDDAGSEPEVMGISIERGDRDGREGASTEGASTDPEGFADPSALADTSWADAVVRVSMDRCEGDGSGAVGTGVLVDGVVLTNRHVVDGGTTVSVETLSGQRYKAVSMRVSPHTDFATLVVPELHGGLSLRTAATVSRADAGDAATTITMPGFPGGLDLAVQSTVIVDTIRHVGYPDPIEPLQVAATVVPGQSGSPLIDDEGRLVGLLYARAYDDGAGLAISAEELDDEWARLVPAPFADCAA